MAGHVDCAFAGIGGAAVPLVGLARIVRDAAGAGGVQVAEPGLRLARAVPCPAAMRSQRADSTSSCSTPVPLP